MRIELKGRHIFIQVIKIILLTCVSFNIGCRIRDLSGIYEIKYHPGYAIIMLNENGSFEYFINMELAGTDTFYGTWFSKGNNVILKLEKPSIKAYISDKDYVVENILKNSNDLKSFNLLIENEPPDLIGVIRIDDDTIIKTNRNGEANLIYRKKIKKLTVSYPGEPDLIYHVKESSSNNFIINKFHTDWVPVLRRNFINKWNYKKNTLYPVDGKIKFDEPYKKKTQFK